MTDLHIGQIVMARWLGQTISETARLVCCFRSAVVRIYKQWANHKLTTGYSRQCSAGKPWVRPFMWM